MKSCAYRLAKIIRFYAGRAPSFCRHIFEFREALQNPRLYRFLGENFLEGFPDKIEIADKNLGTIGRRLLISMLSDPVGKAQLLSVSRTARAAISRNRNSNGKLTKVFPVFGLPHKADCTLSAIGSHRDVIIQHEDQKQKMSVFAVTRITKTGHIPPEQDMTILNLGGSIAPSPIPRPTRRANPHEDIPHDALEASDTDGEILVEMGIDIDGDYPGLENIGLKEELIYTDDQQSPFFENEDGLLEKISKLSTERGIDVGGTTGHGRGYDRDEPSAIQKPLLLVDEQLPNLIECEPDVELFPEDIEIMEYEEVPARLKLVAACIGKTKSGLRTEWVKSFFGKKTYGNKVPLLNLGRFKNEEKLPATNSYRRALVGVIAGDKYQILIADIENQKSEFIGIFTILLPIDTPVTWKNISYILQHRLDFKTWPNAETHGGGYAAKVHPHKSFFEDDKILGRTISNYVQKLQKAAQHI